jgi:hypothetical protein
MRQRPPTGAKKHGHSEQFLNCCAGQSHCESMGKTLVSLETIPSENWFQISVLTDRIEVKFFVHEDWRAQDAVDSLDAKLISSIDTERLGAVWIEYREQPTRL